MENVSENWGLFAHRVYVKPKFWKCIVPVIGLLAVFTSLANAQILYLDFGVGTPPTSPLTSGYQAFGVSFNSGTAVNPSFNIGSGLTLSFTGTVGNYSAGNSSQPLTTDGFFFHATPVAFSISGLNVGDTVSLYAIDGWDGASKAALVSFNGGPLVSTDKPAPGTSPTISNFATIATGQIATGSVMTGSVQWNPTATEAQLGGFIIQVTPQSVPEPSTWALTLSGLLALVVFIRRKSRTN